MLSNKEICDCHSDLRAQRALEEPQWREIATLLKPEDRDIGNDTSRNRVADDIFDSTPLLALEQFVGGLFSQSTNPADRWFDLGIGDEDLKGWGPVKTYLWNFSQLVYASFAPAASPFYAVIPGTYADLGAFGSGYGYSDLGQGASRFTDLHIPVGEGFIKTDGSGYLTAFHREFTDRGEGLKRKFGEAAGGLDEKRQYRVVHAVFENEGFAPGRLGPKGQRWASVYCLAEGNQNFRVEKGYYEMPYYAIPWTLRAGRYPMGPGHLARADVSMLNEMERSHIVAAQFDAEPPLLAHDESIITAADIEPRKLLYGTLNEQGKQLLQRLERGSDLKLSMLQSEQRRAAIRETFLFSIMQLVNRPQMTATEFLGFKEEQLRLMGPNLGRIHSFGLAPLIARRARMLQRAGMVPPPPRELVGHSIEVAFISPLAKAQKFGQARAILQFAQSISGFAQFQPDAMDNFDSDAASEALADGYGVPPGVQRARDEIAKLRQQRAQQQQQMVATEQAAQLAGVYADVAHANQAQTRSAQRGQPGGAS